MLSTLSTVFCFALLTSDGEFPFDQIVIPPNDTSAWEKTELGDGAWRGYTHAQAIGQSVYFLHGRDLEVLKSDGSTERFEDVLPESVGPFTATTVDHDGMIVVAPGEGKAAFRLDPETRKSRTVDGLALNTLRGARLAADSSGAIYYVIGGRHQDFGRWTEEGTDDLSPTRTVNPVGGYSSGLFRVGDVVILFGDHHVNEYRPADHTWKKGLFKQLGFRPAHDRGGMLAQDPLTEDVYMTLGKGSVSLGVLDVQQRQFFHLRPRLPVPLRDAGRTLFVTRSDDGPARLGFYSEEHGAIFSVALEDLVRIGANRDRRAEEGSPWEVWNSRSVGSVGDLARQADSVANLVFVDPYVFLQRKNIVRQIHHLTTHHSTSQAGFRYGESFATEGAALCSDGEDRIYLCNGNDRSFYALELREKLNGETVSSAEAPVDVGEMFVRSLAALPCFDKLSLRDRRGENTTMVFHRGQLYALFDSIFRIVYRYDPASDRWFQESVLPGDVPYSDQDGLDLLSDGKTLYLLSSDSLVTYDSEEGWSQPVTLPFRYSANGGMAALDPDTGWIYVALGGGSRDLAVIEAGTGRAKVYHDFLPDAVSVHGRRMFIANPGGQKHLYLFRGHDSAEHWRTPIP